jgi:endonuclease YncB( thermonuclease family)
MKTKARLFALLFLLLIPSLPYAGQFKITSVLAGDAVAIESHHLKLRVKLAGIDAPEMTGQPYSQHSKRHLADLVLNKFINLKQYGKDRNGWILGVVYAGTKNINLEMVKAGYAEVSREQQPRGLNTATYLTAEAEARKAKQGMWVQGDGYVSPRHWRKMH